MTMNSTNEHFFNKMAEIRKDLGLVICRNINKHHEVMHSSMDNLIEDLKDLTDEALSSPMLDQTAKNEYIRRLYNLLEDFKNSREAINRVKCLQAEIKTK
ncbi:hypothetical protein [Pantoea sp. Taur]|uniref:hypothetical protein n=1 Tax=Pantoea sp. Taur TaxID=2576757 RepID=UPI001352A9C0|nr:hypothetical protein [Pantoea sp. Taur]MXP59549.1 hypothetical protein [Pantoea sp. Taur]